MPRDKIQHRFRACHRRGRRHVLQLADTAQRPHLLAGRERGTDAVRKFFGLIAASGIVLLLFYAVGTRLLPVLSGALSIETGPLVSSALMFLLPALLLGTVSPYAVKLQAVHDFRLHSPTDAVARF